MMYLDLAMYINSLQEPTRSCVIIVMLIFLIAVIFIYSMKDTN